MSTTCGFFNSVNKDRRYNATHFGHCFDGIILDGVLSSIGDCFAIKAAGGMNITVGSGKAWYLYTWLENDADLPMTLAESDVVLSRIDAVVMEFDSTETVRWNDIKLIQGVASSVPERPALVRTKTKVQIPLAYIYVSANSSEITQADITIVIGTDECPFVTGILQTVSLDTLLGQWRSELDQFIDGEESLFDEWFNYIKDQLGEDAAGNLQNQINNLRTQTVSVTLLASGWSASAPYTQTVNVGGLTDALKAKAYPVWPEALEDKLALSEETAKIKTATRSGSTMTFECWEDKPALDIPVTVEVYV